MPSQAWLEYDKFVSYDREYVAGGYGGRRSYIVRSRLRADQFSGRCVVVVIAYSVGEARTDKLVCLPAWHSAVLVALQTTWQHRPYA